MKQKTWPTITFIYHEEHVKDGTSKNWFTQKNWHAASANDVYSFLLWKGITKPISCTWLTHYSMGGQSGP